MKEKGEDGRYKRVTPPSDLFLGRPEKKKNSRRRRRRACHLWDHVLLFICHFV